jgi:hypothetical protein
LGVEVIPKPMSCVLTPLDADLPCELETGSAFRTDKKRRRQDSGDSCTNATSSLAPPAFTPTFLMALTPHPLDETIRFNEETHTYWVKFVDDITKDGDFDCKNVISVSGFVHEYFQQFDADAVITRMQASKTWKQSKYYGMTREDIKRQWQDSGTQASENGTAFHFVVECICNGWDIESRQDWKRLPAVQQWLRWKTDIFDQQGLVPFRTELRFRSDAALRLTGTADLIAVAANHPPPAETGGVLTLHIKDWKHSKAIRMVCPYGKKGIGLLSHLDDVNFNHYALQQNLYKWLLETFYYEWTWRGMHYTSVSVASMELVVCHADHGEKCLVVPIPVMAREVQHMVAARRQALLQAGVQE